MCIGNNFHLNFVAGFADATLCVLLMSPDYKDHI